MNFNIYMELNKSLVPEVLALIQEIVNFEEQFVGINIPY